MRLQLIRHATLLLELAGRRLLIDPMLDPAGARPPVGNTANDRRNPLVDLPSRPRRSRARPTRCSSPTCTPTTSTTPRCGCWPPRRRCSASPRTSTTLRERGFSDVRPVEDALEWRGVHVARTPARHGTGKIGEAMAPASGFVLRAEGEPSIYVAGDTIWCDEVRATLDVQRPDIVVVNASGARFTEGDPIVMTADDVVALTRHVPGAPVVAVHLEAINHCLETPRGPARPPAHRGPGGPRQRARGRRCGHARAHGAMSPTPHPSSGQIGQK